MKSILEDHLLGKQNFLDESHKSMDTPKGMKIPLMPHQQTMLCGLVDFENARVVKITYKGKPGFLRTSALRLNSPFGSGKTAVILALICHRKIPKAFPSIRGKASIDDNGGTRLRDRQRAVKTLDYAVPVVESRYDTSSLISPNLIVVGSSVLLQWEAAIAKFTTLKVFTISGYYDMCKFMTLYESGDIRAFDIVLLKNGKIMGKFPFSDNIADSTMNVMSTITAGKCWSRVIYDDFDIINIPPTTYILETLFTIYVSATERNEKVAIPKNKAVATANMRDLIVESRVMLRDVVNDQYLLTNFSTSGSDEYTKQSTNLPIVTKHSCVYANPNDNVIRLAGAMADDEAREIVEMLNSDAPDTAAARLGIKSNSCVDIFKRMLGKKHEGLISDTAILESIENALEVLSKCHPHKKMKQHSLEKIDALVKAAVKKATINPKYYSEKLAIALDDMKLQYTRSRDANRMAIDRVIDNVKGGDCQICQIPLCGESAYIIRCCGLIVCSHCGIKGNQIGMRYHYKVKGKTLYGKCANCRAEIFPQQDMIFVDENFDLEAIIECDGTEAEDIIEVDEDVDVESGDVVSPLEQKIQAIANPKHRAIIRLCHGMSPEGVQPLQRSVHGLIEGTIDVPKPENTPLKILIFAPYSETLLGIENTLLDFEISFVNLKGTAKDKFESAGEFSTGKSTVMLANSKQDCGGLDLQMSDAVVFYNRVYDMNVEGQIAGRIQRIRRKYNGKIFYLNYTNESETNFGS
tara:strand:- start:2548 stop:4794 length:2247 start_codon:yes stop_codon:yes gene_type:complete